VCKYKQCRYEGKKDMVHRAVWKKANGPIPIGYEIHHINGNRLDNRLENLACLSKEEHDLIHGRFKK
jgi:hypothetical protein